VPLSSDAFYLQELPSSLQQGDIANGVPLILVPLLNPLVIVRSAHHRLPFDQDHLVPGQAELVDELALNDAFERGSEYSVTSVMRGLAMLITPTCDLQPAEDVGGVWTVWPLHPIADSGLDEGNLNAGKYTNLYRIPEHDYFDSSFIDVTDIRPLRPRHFPMKNRVASITREAEDSILQKFHRSFGRTWGYAEGETIEPLGKYETGKFKCAGCNLYDIASSEIITLKPGDTAPACDHCKKIGRRAQWYPLTKHRKG
jgi:hypothetical protein